MARMLNSKQQVLRQELRILKQRVHVLDSAAGDTSGIQCVDPVVDTILTNLLVDDGVSALEITDPRFVVGEVWVVIEMSKVKHFEESSQKHLASRRDCYVAILGTE